MKYDAVIVGARCAGAATAMLLARAGARVLLLDRGAYATDTTSTHALMRGGVLQLHRWGLLPAVIAAGTPAVRSTTFSYVGQDITVAIEPRGGVDALYAPRRVLLDRLLVDAAVASGVAVRHGAHVKDVVRDPRGRARGVIVEERSVRHRISADVVVGADGVNSTVAARVGAPYVAVGRHSTATLYSYWEDLPPGGYYWRFQAGVSMGAIPTNAGATCVFVSVPAASFREAVSSDPTSAYLSLLHRASPLYGGLVEVARRVEAVRGFAGHQGYIRRSAGPGWALVGDAGYFKDPLTAHGITDALRDAELLARAIAAGTAAALAGYERMRDDLSRRLFEITDAIASLDWSDETVQALHRSFSAEMSREVRALASLEPFACPLPSASARPAV